MKTALLAAAAFVFATSAHASVAPQPTVGPKMLKCTKLKSLTGKKSPASLLGPQVMLDTYQATVQLAANTKKGGLIATQVQLKRVSATLYSSDTGMTTLSVKTPEATTANLMVNKMLVATCTL